MGLVFGEWEAFIAGETNATSPFCLFLSNIVDQKEVVLRVALHVRSKCSLHVSPSNGCRMSKREPSICQAFLNIRLRGLKSIHKLKALHHSVERLPNM